MHLLPSKLGKSDYYYRMEEKQEMAWYEDLYNKTIGSSFYQGTLRQPLEGHYGFFHLSSHHVLFLNGNGR